MGLVGRPAARYSYFEVLGVDGSTAALGFSQLDSQLLSKCTKKPNTKPLGVIAMAGVSSVRADESAVVSVPGPGMYAFELQTSTRTWKLRCDDEPTRQAWVSSLDAVKAEKSRDSSKE